MGAAYVATDAGRNPSVGTPIASLLLYILGGCLGLTGLVLLIASCVKCCCANDMTVVVDGRNDVVAYEVGGAPVQGDVEVEVELGSDAQFLGGVDVEMPRTDIELEVEVEAPEVEIEVELEAPEVEIEVELEAPEVEIEVDAEVEV